MKTEYLHIKLVIILLATYSWHTYKRQKGSRRFYDILAHVGEMGVTNRWGNQFGNINDKEWKLYNSSIKDIEKVKLIN